MATRTIAAVAPHHEQAEAWHALPAHLVEDSLGTGPRGLCPEEADARLRRHGPNALPDQPPTSPLVMILNHLRSPLIAILLVAMVITLILREYIDTMVIAVVVVLDVVIGFVQERRAETSVRALASMVAPHARAIRGGREIDLESRELVPGDLVLLESGARTPADLRLVSVTALQVDESPLTGESLPVDKHTTPLPEATALIDRGNMIYAGTTTTSGRARGYVVATGSATQLGAIATQVREAQEVHTPMEERMARFARVIGLAVAIVAVLAFTIGVVRGEPAADIFMVAVALSVSAIPEGLPVATTIALAVGVRRMAKRNAILRHLPAVETLGSTTVIGSDKTGTLTENRMTIQRVWTAGRFVDLTVDPSRVATDPALARTLLTGTLTNEAEVTRREEGWEIHGDPTEAALLIAAATCGLDVDGTRASTPTHAELPFEPHRQYSASLRDIDGRSVLCVKGAPERVLAMSTAMLGPNGEAVPLDREAVHAAASILAADGLRVLAMSYAEDAPVPAGTGLLPEPDGLVFAGLTGMLDPPRAGVRDAIATCRRAGMRTVMITGDHAATAQAIGRDLRLVDGDAQVINGTELAGYDDDRLRDAVGRVAVYARVAPDQKLRVVNALQARGEVVAVTGDGVNDAPALKAADIGIAMGRSGTDVARESADMVLADDNFVSIINAVEEGRITFDNIRKVAYFLIGTGAAEVLAILIALIAGWPLPMLAAQILWLNLVTNGLQDVALAFEPGEPNILERRPRPRSEGILSRLLWNRVGIVAVVMATGTLAMFHGEYNRSGSLVQAQTVALTTMVLFQVFQAGNCRSETRSIFRVPLFSNPFLFLATAAALLVHIAALYLPPTQFVLRVEPIGLDAWLRIVVVASSVVIASEVHKWLGRRAQRTPSTPSVRPEAHPHP